MAVVQKIITGDDQPHEGYGIVQPQLANASGYQTIEPVINRGLTIAQINTKYDTRFNRPRYYTDTPSGLPY